MCINAEHRKPTIVMCKFTIILGLICHHLRTPVVGSDRQNLASNGRGGISSAAIAALSTVLCNEECVRAAIIGNPSCVLLANGVVSYELPTVYGQQFAADLVHCAWPVQHLEAGVAVPC